MTALTLKETSGPKEPRRKKYSKLLKTTTKCVSSNKNSSQTNSNSTLIGSIEWHSSDWRRTTSQVPSSKRVVDMTFWMRSMHQGLHASSYLFRCIGYLLKMPYNFMSSTRFGTILIARKEDLSSSAWLILASCLYYQSYLHFMSFAHTRAYF